MSKLIPKTGRKMHLIRLPLYNIISITYLYTKCGINKKKNGSKTAPKKIVHVAKFPRHNSGIAGFYVRIKMPRPKKEKGGNKCKTVTIKYAEKI